MNVINSGMFQCAKYTSNYGRRCGRLLPVRTAGSLGGSETLIMVSLIVCLNGSILVKQGSRSPVVSAPNHLNVGGHG